MELLAGLGIGTWMTASNALMADYTQLATRGQGRRPPADLVPRGERSWGRWWRGSSLFRGDLRDVFLFIAVCKVAVIIVTLFWVRDSRGRPRPVIEPHETAAASCNA